MRHLVILVAVFVLAASARAVPPPLPDLSTFPNGMGVNIHFTDPKPGELEQIYAAGFRWVRMDFAWAGIEREKGKYDFSAYDRLLKALDEHQMHAYLILDYSNHFYDSGLSPSSDEGRAAFATWAAASVHHFKGRGVIWEMYNEPNIGFWKPTPNVNDYAKLALAVGKAIVDAEPNEIYIGPATSTIDMPFLEACFKAGCLEYWSAVSVHPYRQTDPETVADEYRKLRELIARYAPKGRQIPIISGEWGYSSAWQHFDEERQAKYLPREVLTNIANDVPLSIWYDWHEDGKDPKEAEHHFGIVRSDAVNRDGSLYEPKKAFLAAQRMSETLAGYRFNKRLAIGGEDSYVLLFDKPDGKTAIVSWTTSDAKLELPMPVVSGAVVRGAFGCADINRPASQKGLGFTPDEFPTYILPAGREDLLRIAAAWSRAPQEISVAGPSVQKIETFARNPLDHPITIRIGDRKSVLQPGESCAVALEQSLTRSSQPTTVLLTLDVDGLGRVAQWTSLLVTNPLTAIVFPRLDQTQKIRIENPAGDALHGTAKWTGAADVPIDAHAGDHSLTLAFTLTGKYGENVPSRLTLLDGENRTLLDSDRPANYEYIPLKDFGKSEPSKCWTLELKADGDPKVASEQKLSFEAPPDGPPVPGADSARIAYRFEKGWKFLRLEPGYQRNYKGIAKLGLWVHGDASGNISRMRFTDSTGQTFQPGNEKITWTGWRYLEFPMTGHDAGHWGGANDGVVHFPIHIDTLFLLDSPDRLATQGQIYLSTPTLIYAK